MHKWIAGSLIITIALGLGCAGTKSEQAQEPGPFRAAPEPELLARGDARKEKPFVQAETGAKLDSVDLSLLRQRTEALEEEFITAANTFAFESFKRVYSDVIEDNPVYSPISLYLALGMAYDGAAGPTAIEFEQLMHIDNEQPFNEQAQACIAYLKSRSDLMGVTNEIEEGVPLKDEYKQRMTDKFYVEFKAAQREGVVILRNITEFDGDWMTPFEEANTQMRDFHGALTASQVETMYRYVKNRYLFIDSPELHAAILPYQNTEEYSATMRVFVPQNGDLDAFIADLDAEVVDPMRFTGGKGSIQLPKWDDKIKMDLNDVLQIMGLEGAFKPVANFSRMSTLPLYIYKVIQKARITVDEEGTEAKAVTEISMVTSARPDDSPRFDFAADEPFFYMVVDEPTGLILFMGVVRNPLMEE